MNEKESSIETVAFHVADNDRDGKRLRVTVCRDVWLPTTEADSVADCQSDSEAEEERCVVDVGVNVSEQALRCRH